MNTQTSLLQINVDRAVLTQAEGYTKSLGTTVYDAINTFLKNIILTKGQILRRSDREEAEPSPYLKNILRDASRNTLHDSPSFHSAKDYIDWLEKQGI